MPYTKDAGTLCKNLIAEHGYERFAEIVEALRANTMPRELGVRFGFSSQVSVALRKVLGKVRSTYLLDPVVDLLLAAGPPAKQQPAAEETPADDA